MDPIGNFEEFSVWRAQENREVNYACLTGRKYPHGEERKVYECNRSDYKGFVSSAKKRNFKTGGSIHIHGTCPSRFIVNVSTEGTVTVKFVETHVGHTDELRTKRLSKAEQETIVQKLTAGVSNQRIIEDSRLIHNDRLERRNLVTRGDLAYLIRKFKIDKRRDASSDAEDSNVLYIDEPSTSKGNYQDDVTHFILETRPHVGTIAFEDKREIILQEMNNFARNLDEESFDKASCLSLFKPAKSNSNDAAEEKHKNTKDEGLRDMIASCRSLSKYEGKTLKSLFPQILASLLAASFHIGNGISLAYSAVLISQLEEPSSPFKSTNTENSWIASVLIVVIPPASVVSGIIMDNLGRLNCIKIAGIPGVVGWSMIALANDVTTIIFGRLLVGISSAWGTSPGIVYITEIASSNLRMSLMAIAPAYVSLGMVLTYLGGWYLHWRTLAWICNIFIVVPCLVCIVIHESPSWLILRGKYEQARKSLEWIHKYQKKPGEKETYADLQYKLLQEEQQKKKEEQEKQKHKKGIAYIAREFMKPTGWKPLVILTGLFFFQHFSGIYITMFYSITFIKEAGSSVDGYLASILIGAVRFIMSISGIYILKRYRRRPLIFVSSTLMALCMFTAGLWTRWIKEGTTELKWIPVLALLFYVIASTLGLLPIPNMLIAELFPLEIRGIGYSVSYSLCCVLMFIALQSYYTMSDFFGGSSNLQWFFAVICLGGAVYSYIFMPETFGMKLSDITEYFKVRFVYIGHEGNKSSSEDDAEQKMLKENVNNNDKVQETV